TCFIKRQKSLSSDILASFDPQSQYFRLRHKEAIGQYVGVQERPDGRVLKVYLDVDEGVFWNGVGDVDGHAFCKHAIAKVEEADV
ncbi:hypothetical protein HW555_010153, partial [Spodoptera exigua]